MSKQKRLAGPLKGAWGTATAMTALGAVAVIGLVADLAQLDNWITTGGPPVIRVLCYVILIIAGWQLWKEKLRYTPRTVYSAIVAVVCIGTIAAAPALWPTTTSDATPSSAPPNTGSDVPPSEPVPVLVKTGYRLAPSSNPLTNDGDKIDLDTGCPGWGPTSVRVGRNRCGDLADLIVETQGLHAPDDAPRLSPVDQASYASCRDRDDHVGIVRLTDLRHRTELCARTDKDNIAAIHIDSVSDNGEIVISYTLWKA
jgi:hypothetical protein